MKNSLKTINTITVVGANGTMGRNIAAIFASFGNATVYLVSRTLEKSIEAKNLAYRSVRAESVKEKMIPKDYDQLEDCVTKSELIFEACAENWDVKEDIHRRISEVIKNSDRKVICSGTSGLSITKLAEIYAEEYRYQFMGMHMFNPPYQMTLCELISTKYTEADRSIFEFVKSYADVVLHRTVVEITDSPAFLGNRIGFQFINESLQMAEKYKYNGGIDYIDSIIGPFTGRSMPPLVTANFVGLDVHKAIVNNLYEQTNDYAHNTYILPTFVEKLINSGKIGRKAGEGLYKTIIHDNGTKIHQVYDIEHGYYREKMKYTFSFVEEMIRFLRIGDYESAFQTLVRNQSTEAKLCCEFLLKYIVYGLYAAKELGCGKCDADDVMAAGFHWCPPVAMFEAFSTVVDFEKLCKERLERKIFEILKKQSLQDGIEKSRYDYRKFILANR
ncbi:3-hydroxyacyl-CoA dehydrogenase family protein [Sporofaciens musculi]|uniref:3-hydroxyacyl-CoA dehydrogenase family protein n=1 Tax=Sporofaciens musculi TaxID=2681861 RepID=UPI002570E0AD|nr:3-hydroxyacyl-CoA dehydrogenase family protein [Sporofaciens musculi]